MPPHLGTRMVRSGRRRPGREGAATWCNNHPVADRRLHAELLLLALVAEGDRRRGELEGALDAAGAVGLIGPADTAWLDGVRGALARPVGALALRPQQRAALRDLLAGLRREQRAEPEGDGASLHCDVLQVAEELGVRGCDLLGRDEAVELDPEPLLRLRAVLPARTGALLCLECYDGGLVVRTRRASGGEEPIEPPELVDDVGGGYRFEGGGGGQWRFTPGVPAGARRLTVSFAGERSTLDVSGVAERPGV